MIIFFKEKIIYKNKEQDKPQKTKISAKREICVLRYKGIKNEINID